jgi:predicted Zn-dependent protease
MIRDEREIKGLLQDILAAYPGKTMGIGISGHETSSTRFANNAVTTNGSYDRLEVYVELFKGKKRGIANGNQLHKEGIREIVEKADALANVAPENPEAMPLLGAQSYPSVPNLYHRSTAECPPARKIDAIIHVVEKAKKNKLEAAGFFETTAGFSAYCNSQGLYYYFPSTRCYFSNTLRGRAGGSGWAAADEENVDRLPVGSLGERAVRKALLSRAPRPLPAGKYTVILEPAAVADMVWYLLYNFTAREADEGRSCMSLADGKNRLGEKMVSPLVNLFSDPALAEVPVVPTGDDGLPQKRTAWIENGMIRNLIYTRFWAEKQGRAPVSFPSNIAMAGEDRNTLDDLIRATKKGVLISRFWYIRDLNPMILLLTGLTRDGTFLIENGKIRHPVNNFRFNESPINLLRNVEMMSRPQRAVGGETGQSALVPGLKVREFNFSSISDAV